MNRDQELEQEQEQSELFETRSESLTVNPTQSCFETINLISNERNPLLLVLERDNAIGISEIQSGYIKER